MQDEGSSDFHQGGWVSAVGPTFEALWKHPPPHRNLAGMRCKTSSGATPAPLFFFFKSRPLTFPFSSLFASISFLRLSFFQLLFGSRAASASTREALRPRPEAKLWKARMEKEILGKDSSSTLDKITDPFFP